MMANFCGNGFLVFNTCFPRGIRNGYAVKCILNLLTFSKGRSLLSINSKLKQVLFFTDFDKPLGSDGLVLIKDPYELNDICDVETKYLILDKDLKETKLFYVSKDHEQIIKQIVESVATVRDKRHIKFENIESVFESSNSRSLVEGKSNMCKSKIEDSKEKIKDIEETEHEQYHSFKNTDDKTKIDDANINEADLLKKENGKIAKKDDATKTGYTLEADQQNIEKNTSTEITKKNLEKYFKSKPDEKSLRNVKPRSSRTAVVNNSTQAADKYKRRTCINKNKELTKSLRAGKRINRVISNVKAHKEFEDLDKTAKDKENDLTNRKTVSLHQYKNDSLSSCYNEHLIRHLREITNLPGRQFQPANVNIIAFPSRHKKYNKPAIRRTPRPQRQENDQFPVQVSNEGNEAAGPPTFGSVLTSSASVFRHLPATSDPPVPHQPTIPTTNLIMSLDEEQSLLSRRQGLNRTSTRPPPRPPHHPEYADRNARQLSFTNWPPNTHQDPTAMVNYGFFFTGRFDLVRCFQCGIGLKDWAEPDEPLFEHIKHASHCPYLLELLGPELLAAYKANLVPAGASPIGAIGAQGTPPTEPNPNQGTAAGTADTSGIRNPEYTDMEARVRSFNSSWPSDITQTPQQLAEAGFFYTGYGDVCRCFTCDGGLQRWDPQDDPWIEHTRWFSHCAYVRRIKGDEYVELVRRALVASSEDEDPAVVYPPPGAENITGGMANLSIATADPLSTPAAQSVLNTGYSRKAVLLAIHELSATGKRDYTGNDIIQVLMDKEDRGEPLPTDSPTNSMELTGATGGVVTSDPGNLETENLRLKGILKCMQCEVNDTNILFLPCTHHRLCEECAKDAEICPVCGRIITQKIKTFMS